MSEFKLPFPGKNLADKELTYDYCYAKIPQEDRKRIVDMAWKKGEAIAKVVYAEEKGNADFFDIMEKHGLTVKEKNVDFVSGKQRYFSDYVSGRNEVNLYLKSVQLWADENHLDLRSAENLILSHEYYHFLEVTRIGLTSKECQVPMLVMGKLKIGKTGIHALSEIGAHAFAKTYWDLVQGKC